MERGNRAHPQFNPTVLVAALSATLGLACLPALADFLDLKSPDPMSSKGARISQGHLFMAPNEHSPRDLAPLVKNAPAGVHISVGTERGFIGAALNPGATHLLLVDVSHFAAFFNRYNIALLQLARDRQDYLHLRLKADHAEILYRLEDATGIEPAYRKMLASARDSAMFRAYASVPAFNPLYYSIPQEGEFAFRDANYLQYDDQFAKISRMAKEGKIEAHLLDLAKPRQVRSMMKSLDRVGLRVSAFDISNAHVPTYIARGGLRTALTELLPRMSPGSVFVFTTIAESRRDVRGFMFDRWSYHGASKQALEKLLADPKALDRFLDRAPITYGGSLFALDDPGLLSKAFSGCGPAIVAEFLKKLKPK